MSALPIARALTIVVLAGLPAACQAAADPIADAATLYELKVESPGKVASGAQGCSYRRVCAVGAYNEVAGNLLQGAGGGAAQRQQPALGVEVLAGCLEAERGACSLRCIEQQGVEVAA